MNRRQVARLLKLSQLALDECRRDLAAADLAVTALDLSVRGTRHERARAVLEIPAAGLSSVGAAVVTLDRREERLAGEQGVARERCEEARRRVVSALQRSRTLERLHEIRIERERLVADRREESLASELARVLQFRTARLESEDRHDP